jgi:hypothetical protein
MAAARAAGIADDRALLVGGPAPTDLAQVVRNAWGTSGP